MIQAAPLVISFARLVPALEKLVGAVGISTLTAKVNEHIEENPEESAMILKTLVPNLGIGEIFMKKEDKISLEDLEDMTDEEAQDLSKEEKAELMKQAGKSGGKNKRQTMIDLSEKLGLSGPGREKQDIEYEVDERYDEGGVEDAPKPKFDYKRFFRKADGGAIGVESLFEERKNFRGGGLYQGVGGYGKGVSTKAKAPPSMGFGNPPPGSGGGGGGGAPPQTKTKKPIFKSDIDPRFQGLVSPAAGVKFDFLKKQKFYNQPFKLEGITPLELAGAEIEGGIGDLKNLMGGEMTVGNVLENMAGGSYSNVMPSTQDKIQEQILGQVDFGKTFQKDIVGPYNPVVEPTFKGGVLDIDVGKGDLVDKKAEKFLDLKEGGRVGFNVGGITDPQALAIYNSMNAYGFSDQEIADAITAQGYDAGTLGQTTTPTAPTTPTPSEGIIGIDLQQRDTGGGFNPFGPLQSTFTKDLSEVEGFDYLTPTQQMNKYKAQTQDNMFGLGKFFQPKIRGTLGNRLQKQFQTGQKLPSFAAAIAGAQSPFNPDSKNYNKDFVDQLNYLEGMEGLIGMSDVGLKYGPESVLFGKNVISGFGSNNYLTALNKFIRNTKNEEKRKQGERERDAFLAAEKARKEREAKEQLEIQRAATRAADRRAGAFDDRVRLDPGGGGTFKQQTAAKERQGVQVAGPGFGKGAYFADGGLASMFVEKR